MRSRSSKRLLSPWLFGAVLAASAALWSATALNDNQAFASDPRGAPPSNPVFARSVAGTWMWVDTEFGQQEIETIRADGTLDWYGSWFFGAGSESFLVRTDVDRGGIPLRL
jgi:hypothetical protein